jgi:hypothetical protein
MTKLQSNEVHISMDICGCISTMRSEGVGRISVQSDVER